MDLEFTTEQELLRETVRGVCARHAGLDVVRAMENDPVGYPDKLWSQLAELGLTGLTIGEEHGGSGMTMLDAAIVYQEFGRALVPSPHFASSVVAAGVIERIGSAAAHRAWLPRIASGDAIVVPAWLEPDRGFGPAGVALRARHDTDGWRLSGTKRHVPYARAADRLLVLARSDEGIRFLLVSPSADGVTLTQQHTLASDTQYRIDFADALAEDILGDGGDGWSTWHEVMLDGCILLGAQAVGAARYALDLTVDYAKTRHQFDKPLGAFQALAHYLADRVTEVDGAETLVHEAAWARTAERPVTRLAPMAKLFAGQTFRQVTATGQQIFGGIGFTVEHDIQLYFRRAKQWQLSWWDPRYLEELIAQDMLNDGTP
jgi:alkylation response protein AidB-like acyl-CoA dehydrogenase